MVNTTEVLVVGGGATGTGIARDLALRGVDVTLAERRGLAGGTSGRSHSLLHSGARYAEADPVGAEECIEENRILRRIAGECIGESGGLFVQLEADDPAYFEEKYEACEERGIPAEVIDGDEARRRVPDLSEDAVRAMVVPDGVVYPSRLAAANAADARDNGATILTHAPAEGMTVEGGCIVRVELGGAADVEPDFVVNAAGTWAGQVAAMAGVELEMRPTKGVMISVYYDGLDPVLNRCRPPADGDIIVPHDTEVVLGTTSVEVDDPDDFEEEEWEVEAMFEECSKMLPPVADAEVSRRWWGVRPLYAPDEASRGGRGISRGFFVVDHAADPDDEAATGRSASPGENVENFASIVGGKLTTYRVMAEQMSDFVADRLGVDEPCLTDERPLPGADDPERLDTFVEAFDARSPSDEDVLSPSVHGAD
ncbi:FAD-dependent oxidoreductase [Halopelagius longus]|uniref:Glycerol-3-phosphate dehydrogenase n=1 Tax=Halopelagius longus TaxID=1236180 RepID=A0A1H1AMG7_9EURY|nr:FAD-dependent oxidoreductase [Halopelagius longus]RDI70438.1 FAD-dependent oxidoreductase [Halopelagius longus]SDQ40782.1 glycerol-3-phosphate dehydrogenase [Halopelagius longus]